MAASFANAGLRIRLSASNEEIRYKHIFTLVSELTLSPGTKDTGRNGSTR